MFKPGDLVILIKPTQCCNNTSNVGKIFTVKPEWAKESGSYCYFCKKQNSIKKGNWTPLNGYYCETLRLKKVEPLSETEEQTEALYS